MLVAYNRTRLWIPILAHGYYVVYSLVALAVVVLMPCARSDPRPRARAVLLLGTLIGLVPCRRCSGSRLDQHPDHRVGHAAPPPPWCSSSPTPCGWSLPDHGWLCWRERSTAGEPHALGLTVQVLWDSSSWPWSIEILAGTWSYVDDLWFNPVRCCFVVVPCADSGISWRRCASRPWSGGSLTARQSRRGLTGSLGCRPPMSATGSATSSPYRHRCPRTHQVCLSNTPYGFRRACNSNLIVV